MSETQAEVFEALLSSYRDAELSLMHEFSSDFDSDESLIADSIAGWRLRYARTIEKAEAEHFPLDGRRYVAEVEARVAARKLAREALGVHARVPSDVDPTPAYWAEEARMAKHRQGSGPWLREGHCSCAKCSKARLACS